MHFKHALASVGLCFVVPSALATLPPIEIPCYPSPSIATFSTVPEKSRGKAIRRILLESDQPDCVGGQLFPKGSTTAGLRDLAKLMLSDRSPQVRLRAADALGSVAVGRKLALAELSNNPVSEDDAQVVQARIRSIGALLDQAGTRGWDKSIHIADAIHGLQLLNNNGRRTAEEKEALRFALGRLFSSVGNNLMWAQDRNLGAEERSKAWNSLLRLVAEFMTREPGTSITYDWRAMPLEVLSRAMESGAISLGNGGEVDWLMKTVAQGLDDPHPTVHLASLKLLSTVQEQIMRRMEPGWNDFAPYLTWQAVGRLTELSTQALSAADPEVRSEAARLLGLLTFTRPVQSDLLVNLLRDDSDKVREQAALALARRVVLPKEAVALLSGLARRHGMESPAAMAALSQERSPEALDALIAAMVDTMLGNAEDDDTGLVEQRRKAAARAIGKYGSLAVLPLLRKTSLSNEGRNQTYLYGILENLDWTGQAKQAGTDVEAALTPALTGEDEQTRLFALALLARQPLDPHHRYASPLVEELLRRYLHDAPQEMSEDEANPKVVWLGAGSDGVESWRIAPEAAAATIAGGSASPVAAEMMVSWLCSGKRLELQQKTDGLIVTFGGSPLANEMDTSRAMVASLERMGGVAKPFIGAALASGKSTALCRRYLGAGDARAEESGSQPIAGTIPAGQAN